MSLLYSQTLRIRKDYEWAGTNVFVLSEEDRRRTALLKHGRNASNRTVTHLFIVRHGT